MDKTALELGPEGWKPYLEGRKKRPDPTLSRTQVKERDRLMRSVHEAAVVLKTTYGATRVILFGSLAEGRWFDEHSDVDLAVEGIKGAAIYRAWAHIQAIIADRRVDLVDPQEARSAVRDAIEQRGIEI